MVPFTDLNHSVNHSHDPRNSSISWIEESSQKETVDRVPDHLLQSPGLPLNLLPNALLKEGIAQCQQSPHSHGGKNYSSKNEPKNSKMSIWRDLIDLEIKAPIVISLVIEIIAGSGVYAK